MATNTPPTPSDLLAAVPSRHAQPDPKTLATVPKGGVNLVYMGHAEVTLALIDIDPMWTWEPLAYDPTTGGPLISTQGNRLVMWGRVTVHGKSIIGCGTCEARKGEPEKELVGDMIRNAAMRFGIGTKLWSKAVDEPVKSASPLAPERRKAEQASELFERCKAADDSVKAELRAIAEQAGRKIGVASFLEDAAFARQIDHVLNTKAAAA